jgi:hypothetical protein
MHNTSVDFYREGYECGKQGMKLVPDARSAFNLICDLNHLSVTLKRYRAFGLGWRDGTRECGPLPSIVVKARGQ